MLTLTIRRLCDCLTILSCLLLLVQTGQGQNTPEQKQPAQDDEVVRINTELVQTDVMVFDKQGHFVNGLKPEQFVLKIDDKPRPIAFFENVTSESLAEKRKAQAETNKAQAETNVAATTSATATPGRTLIFFVDDLHLAPDSLARARKALLQFIENGMRPNDQVAITSSSGQIGFLQQFTDDKFALRNAVARLNYRASTKTDMDNPPMSEYIALKINEGDESAISYYVAEIMKQNSFKIGGKYVEMISPQAARILVQQRARQIVSEASPGTDNTLRSLLALMETAAQVPGRKLVFLISDGFYLNDRKTGSADKIRRITDAAGRAGVVIYTLDARGLVTEFLDTANNRPIDSQGLTVSSGIGEIAASQDGLNALARDTGGRPFRNTNRPMSEWVEKVLDETSTYYLLAWRPDTEEQKRGKFNHIQVSIVGRPDLTVRLRSGYFKTAPAPPPTSKRKPNKDPIKAREDELRQAIDALIPRREIQTTLKLNLVHIASVGTQLTALIHIGREGLTFEPAEGTQVADVEVGGIFYDAKGKPVNSFVGRLRVYPPPENPSPTKPSEAVYNFQIWLNPGLYQVRVAVRDVKSGRMGSAMQWIEIPNYSSAR